MRSDKDLLDWMRTDLAAAIEWHGAQAARHHADQSTLFAEEAMANSTSVLRLVEQAKGDMAATILRRLEAYEAGQPPIHPKSR